MLHTGASPAFGALDSMFVLVRLMCYFWIVKCFVVLLLSGILTGRSTSFPFTRLHGTEGKEKLCKFHILYFSCFVKIYSIYGKYQLESTNTIVMIHNVAKDANVFLNVGKQLMFWRSPISCTDSMLQCRLYKTPRPYQPDTENFLDQKRNINKLVALDTGCETQWRTASWFFRITGSVHLFWGQRGTWNSFSARNRNS